MKKHFYYYNKHLKDCLVAKINGLSILNKKLYKKLIKAKDKKIKQKIAYKRQIVNKDIRHHLLAYGYLNNIPYKNMEKTCKINNKPSIDYILKIIHVHTLPSWQECHVHNFKDTLELWLNNKNITLY